MNPVTLLLFVVYAAWPTPEPIPTLPPAPAFPTPRIPTPAIQPMATPALPAPSFPYATPEPGAGAGYTETIGLFGDLISASDEAIVGFGAGIEDLQTALGLDGGTGDWDPGLVQGESVSDMRLTIVERLGVAIAYLKAISYIGSGQSYLGVMVGFLVI